MANSVDSSSAIFIDTNILIYANIAAAPLHSLALQTLAQRAASNTELWISRQIIREFIVTLTHPQTFSNPQPTETIIERVNFLESHFHIAEDGPTVTQTLLNLIRTTAISGKQIHDANVVATMLTVGVEQILTHNIKDFQRFTDLITVVPLQSDSA